MKNDLWLIAIVMCISVTTSCAQEWVARYNGPDSSTDEAYSIAIDSSGNVYVTGRSVGSGTDWDYATIKYGPAGDTVWVRRYNGPDNGWDEANEIVVDGSGNVYVTGWSSGTGDYPDYTTIKYTSSGDTLWVRRYNGPANSDDYTSAIAVDRSGNVYVTGTSGGSGTNYDYATIKYNSAGVEQWVARYNGPDNSTDGANAIAVDGTGNVYVTGLSEDSSTNYDYVTIKYNAAGVEQWVARYNGPDDYEDCAYAIAVDGTENVYVTGESFRSVTYYDYATIKYNAAGIEQWVRNYNGPGNEYDEAYAIAVDESGNVYVTGWSSGGSGTFTDYATIKYNSAGNTMWVRRYNGPDNHHDEANAIAVDGMGNVYVTGKSVGSGGYPDYDYATIKYNSVGDTLWVRRYNGPADSTDEAYSIAVDGMGNVYVTGRSVGSGTDWDYVTIKYSGAGVEETSFATVSGYRLSVSGMRDKTIRYYLPIASAISLRVYDLCGREVAKLVDGMCDTGYHTVNWDTGNKPSGMYFVTLATADYKESKKVVLIR